VNLFIASELNWKEKGIKLTQETKFPYEEQTKIIITESNSSFKLMVRYPSWVADGALKISVNGKAVVYSAHPSSYITISRNWKKGDVVEVMLPMHNTIEHLRNVPSYIAIMHGPILLGAKTGTEDLKGLIADDSRWGQIPGGEKLPVDKAPIIIEDDLNKLTTQLVPVKDKPLNFTIPAVKLINPIEVTLQPFYQIHDVRYMMYWMALSNTQYKSYLDSLSAVEKGKLEQEKRTIDFVAPGEQQPEVDHAMQSDRSRSGTAHDNMYREASDGGYFSYNMATNKQAALSLLVRYWGAEWGSHKFDIYIDDQKLATVDNTGQWNQSSFKEITYSIPGEMLKNKSHIRVKFLAVDGTSAGPVYYVRLIKNTIQE
jgi:hypothetical protein